ncbi:bifunctional serine/threonine-protein kinase/formylglycine-generating enzyme family protein [Tautonia plasticadhaerens]|uniref:Serine/threonine-protein kinase PknB n=1 Tax=Tautonia plasticadhaerens TaxID=2527974 RepID=A0A518GZG6_9BACT|nr:bifunctional serine/threonine-protein kinase/formylglycine-generating enzyme family protein [Tautonia plasticadhaerens]QDV33986.1 Serine/threonine-protein kinase PknB [Tautonia plasticadhaerens]
MKTKGPDDRSRWEHSSEPTESTEPQGPATPPPTDEAPPGLETVSHAPDPRSDGGHTSDPGTDPSPEDFRGLEHLAPGQFLFGKYEVLEELGRGGMGSVWRVRHRELDVERALKLIVSDIAFHPESRARFRREARVMARFSHPNAVHVYDARIAADAAYIEMEFVRGRPLNKEIEPGRPMPPGRAVRIVVQLCDALQAAHEHGIVHRDLKPANLMLVPGPGGSDVVKVLDFGIAKVLDADRDDEHEGLRTEPGMFIGTPMYASPEQINPPANASGGDALDSRSDLYSIGVILFELLTGHRPFAGRSALLDHLTKPPPPFAEVNPDVRLPAEFEAIVRSCLEKDPARRPQSARELADRLRRAAGLDQPLVTPRPGVSRRVAALGVAAVLGLAGVLAWALWPPTPTFAIGAEPPAGLRAGTEADLIVSVDRTRFPGPVRLEIDGLPPGVSSDPDRVEATGRLASFRLRAALDADAGGPDRSLTIRAEAGGLSRTIEVPIVVEPPAIALPGGFERVAGSDLVDVGGLHVPRAITRRFDDGTEAVFLLIDGHRRPDLDPFYILRDKVSNRLYRQFGPPPDPFQDIEVPGISQPGLPNDGVDPDEVPDWPVLGVTAHRADDFAAWLVGDGPVFTGRLPSASQWYKAAGFLDAPGDPPTTADDREGDGIAVRLSHPRPVGTSPGDVAPTGVRDTAGNGMEWTRDSHSHPGASLPLDDDHAHDKIIMLGHSFDDEEPFLPRHVEEDLLSGWFADAGSLDVGFRVVIEIRP